MSGGDNIRIGFIGAGKVGCSLAAYFSANGFEISGFSGRRKTETGFKFYDNSRELADKSDILFLTVTDSAIADVWNGLDKTDEKIVCHCSGSLSSDVFKGADKAYVCSVHPMLAFNTRNVPIEVVSHAFFTLEGGKNAIKTISGILDVCKNEYEVIGTENKAKYHAASCFASNMVVSVCETAMRLLTECGFTYEEAEKALSPLIRNNAENIAAHGTAAALTGPIERGDKATVLAHIGSLDAETARVYEELSLVLADMSGKSEIASLLREKLAEKRKDDK